MWLFILYSPYYKGLLFYKICHCDFLSYIVFSKLYGICYFTKLLIVTFCPSVWCKDSMYKLMLWLFVLQFLIKFKQINCDFLSCDFLSYIICQNTKFKLWLFVLWLSVCDFLSVTFCPVTFRPTFPLECWTVQMSFPGMKI